MALKWYEKGSKEVAQKIGNYYYDKEDCNRAFYWYKKAADQKHPKAQFRVAKAYYSGEGSIIDVRTSEKVYQISL